MNLAKIQVSGVRAVAVDAVREIPAGIVGATVELEYTGGIWAGLNKTVIFRGNTTKEVLTDETTVTMPAEVVAEPRGRLRVGVYGTDAANNLIMPTLWAELGVIADSAEPSEPADSTLPIWAQLYAMIGNLGNLDTAAKSSLVAAVNELVAKSGSADPEEIKKIVEEYMAENPVSGGLSFTTSKLLITILRNGMYSTDQSANITALATELGVTEEEEPDTPVVPDEPEVTLSSISAMYSGGDVTEGTAVSELTGIVVTAHYSNGTSATVTGYTLSGTIAEGENTITVSYGGMTTTFTVTGIAEAPEINKIEVGNLLNYVLYDGGHGSSHESYRTTENYLDATGHSTVYIARAGSEYLLSRVVCYDSDKKALSGATKSTHVKTDNHSCEAFALAEGTVYFRICVDASLVPFCASFDPIDNPDDPNLYT